MKYILSIDQGTTGSRAVVYDQKGREVVSDYNEFKQYFPRPGWVEHDPVDLWESVKKSINGVFSKVPSGSVEAVGITNQRETVLLWDRYNGKLSGKAIVWQCRRTAERCAGLERNKKLRKEITSKTGLPVDAYFSASKIEWIMRSDPEIRKKARKGDLVFGTVDSWLLWKLSGGKVHATDPTNASRTMLFNINTKKWDDGLFDIFGIPPGTAPEVKASSGIFGYTARSGKLPSGIPISGIAGDQQAALFGQACFKKGEIKNTYGTGCFMLINAGKTRPKGGTGLVTTLGCGEGKGSVYVLEGSIFIAGAAIQWLRDSLGLIENADDSSAMAEKAGDSGGVYFVPALVGLGAPYWKSEARGLITGITRCTSKEHIVRAALEAMCYRTKDVFDVMKKASGVNIRQLKVDGGAAKNDFLCQYQSDVLGIDVVRPRVTETTSLGAAYLAGLGIGFWESADRIRVLWKKEKIFRPFMGKAERKKVIGEWEKALRKSLLLK